MRRPDARLRRGGLPPRTPTLNGYAPEATPNVTSARRMEAPSDPSPLRTRGTLLPPSGAWLGLHAADALQMCCIYRPSKCLPLNVSQCFSMSLNVSQCLQSRTSVENTDSLVPRAVIEARTPRRQGDMDVSTFPRGRSPSRREGRICEALSAI